jgi:hypothetical protein
MKISRRRFLGGMTASAATLLSLRPTGLSQPGARSEPFLDCVVLDLKPHCVLRESLQGYQTALAGEHTLLESIPDSRFRCRTVIAPGVGSMEPAIAKALSGLVAAGTLLLLESGAAFVSPSEFAAQRRMLQGYFGLAVLPPVDLWAGKFAGNALFTARRRSYAEQEPDNRQFVPYVNYVWPCNTKVRDFSRVVPVSAEMGDVIGRVGALPVALKRNMASGAIIFLGSLLGPALRAGDPEARSWLRCVASVSGGRPDLPMAAGQLKSLHQS